jgi:hypothetical protein
LATDQKRPLTDSLFETGTYGVSSKSQKPTNGHTLAGSSIGAICLATTALFGHKSYPQFRYISENQVFFPTLDSLFLAKIG